MSEKNALFTGRDTTKVIVTNAFNTHLLSSSLIQTLSSDSKFVIEQINIIDLNLHFYMSITCRATWILYS